MLMEMLKKYKILLIVSGVIAVGAIAFSQFSGSAVPTESLLVANPVADPNERVREELLRLLSELRTLDFDDTIFSDPRFRSLTDFSQEIRPQPVGRKNPFLPIGADAVASEVTKVSESIATSSSTTATSTPLIAP
jgi:hypothetical protein